MADRAPFMGSKAMPRPSKPSRQASCSVLSSSGRSDTFGSFQRPKMNRQASYPLPKSHQQHVVSAYAKFNEKREHQPMPAYAKQGLVTAGNFFFDPNKAPTGDHTTSDVMPCLGFKFWWTKDHITSENLKPMRLMGDPLADEVVPHLRTISKHGDVIALLRKLAAEEDEAAQNFLASVDTPPDWVDWDSIARGQKVIVRHLGLTYLTLQHLSLGTTFSVPNMNATLNCTGYLTGNKANTHTRLMETVHFVFNCCEPGGLLPSARGWRTCVEVRLLHARVRSWVAKCKAYHAEEAGLPVNQEDIMATQVCVSTLSLLGLENAGVRVTRQEAEDLIHLWRLIGYNLGIDDDLNPCSSFERSKAFMESYLIDQLHPDHDCAVVVKHMLGSIAGRFPFHWSEGTHHAIARRMMGDQMADRMELTDSRYHNFIAGYILFVLKLVSLVAEMPGVGPFVVAFEMIVFRLLFKGAADQEPNYFNNHPAGRIHLH